VRLTTLSLEHVRSYERLSLPLAGSMRQVFIGPNGSGKTNIMEAVSLLSWGRSCLRAMPEDVLRWGADYFRIRAEGELDDRTPLSFEYVWQRAPRRQCAAFLRDIRTPFLKFIGSLKTVIFLPEHLDLFIGAPAQRRAFLDILLSQLSPDFTALRVEYERLLKQRNALLKRIVERASREDELTLWDERFSLVAARVQHRRLALAARFTEQLPVLLAALGEEKTGDAVIVYERKTQGQDLPGIAAQCRALLLEARPRDLLIASTTVGPHRDDWHIVLRGHRLQQFASRGQQRASLLALLLVSARILEETCGERPVVLLDDVLSELDDRHQDALLASLTDHQVLITSTHPVPLSEDVTLWNVGEGKVVRAEKAHAEAVRC